MEDCLLARRPGYPAGAGAWLGLHAAMDRFLTRLEPCKAGAGLSGALRNARIPGRHADHRSDYPALVFLGACRRLSGSGAPPRGLEATAEGLEMVQRTHNGFCDAELRRLKG